MANVKIWEALRATSAALTYFKPIQIGKQKFTDGGTGWNNPSEVAVDELLEWSRTNHVPLTLTVMSLGTGMPAVYPVSTGLKTTAQVLLNVATDCDQTHQRLYKNPELRGRYFRFGDVRVSDKFGLDAAKFVGALEAAAATHLDDAKVRDEMHSLVRALSGELNPAPSSAPLRLIPSFTEVFVGREPETSSLVASISAAKEKRSVVLFHSGKGIVGGNGKSTWAAQLAKRLQGSFVGHHFYVNLQGTQSDSGPVKPSEAMHQLLDAVGISPNTNSVPGIENTYRTHFRNILTRALVLLDDATSYEQIQPLLPPDNVPCCVVITSRTSLSIPVPGIKDIEVAGLDPTDSISLLNHLLQPRQHLQEDDLLPKLASVCFHIPQALDLLGRLLARQRDRPINDLLQELEMNSKSFGNKTGLDPCFRASFRSLTKEQKTSLCMITAFQAPFDAAAFLSLCPSRSDDLYELLAQAFLISLSEKDLAPTAKRFTLHDSVRLFLHDEALACANAMGESTQTWQIRVARYYFNELKRLNGLCKEKKLDIAMANFRQNRAAFEASLHILISNIDMTRILAEELQIWIEIVWRCILPTDKVRLFEACMKVLCEANGSDHPDTLSSMNHLANALHEQSKYAEAERLHREVLEKRKRMLGEDHAATISSMNNLARPLHEQCKFAEAEQLYRAAIARYKITLPEDHPDTLMSMNNLGELLCRVDKYEEAEQLHREVLEKRKRILGDDHPDTLLSANQLAALLHRKDNIKHKEAEKHLKECATTAESRKDKESTDKNKKEKKKKKKKDVKEKR